MKFDALPKEFILRAEKVLGDSFDAFRESYKQPSFRGIRLNTLKADKETLEKALGEKLTNTPFSPLSFYCPEELRIGKSPAHHAGMFYSQEPSASSAVTILNPQKDEKILDLCAAPGGKSTQIAALTGDTGLLWSNEIVSSRAAVLSSNLERMGVKNTVVSSCHPEKLCTGLAGWFDKVLVDAPCSGEGMFRREPAALEEWNDASPASCAARQAEILDSASKALRPGGILVYSTCTFSVEENEDTILRFLERHPDFELVSPGVSFGRPAFGIDAVRIFPADGGEGHFAAKMRKKYGAETHVKSYSEGKLSKNVPVSEIKKLFAECFLGQNENRLFFGPKSVFVLPDVLPCLDGLGVVRAGYELCSVLERRLEVSHGAYMCRKKEEFTSYLDLPSGSPELSAFLRGEEIPCPEELHGYAAVLCDGVCTGFGKASGGRLKNKYPKGLRNPLN